MSEILAAAPIEPCYFGPRSRRLYGCYHEPSTWPARDAGVVVCYPVGQEYIRSHRACLHLATAVARSGFPALRFDYYGTGDSAGDPDEVDFERWMGDLELAVEELRARSGVERVILAGLRLGGSLALLAARRIDGLAGLVLWEPVVRGTDYLAEVAQWHHEAILRFAVPPRDHQPGPRPTELLGFPIGEPLYAALEALDLLEVRPPRGRPLLLVESHGAADQLALAERLQPQTRFTHAHVPSFRTWTEDVDKGLVPSQVLAAIVAWLEEVFA